MTPVLIILTLLIPQLPGAFSTVTTVGNLEILEGQSVTVPCHYNSQYSQNVKYWCRGSTYDFCKTLARTDDPGSSPFSKASVTISDDPSQNVFTVTMHELKEENSGWYYCGVEIGGIWKSDSTASVYINVKNGISVVNNVVTGEEGGSITIQFLYSLKHRWSNKWWCRSGHMNSCQFTDSSGTFSSESLLISDDRKDTVNVTIKKLEMRDAGWYLCGVGQQQVSVQVLVKPSLTTTRPLTRESNSYPVWQSSLIVCAVLLLLMTAIFVTWRIWQQHKKKSEHRRLDETESALMVCSRSGGEYKNDSVLFLKI